MVVSKERDGEYFSPDLTASATCKNEDGINKFHATSLLPVFRELSKSLSEILTFGPCLGRFQLRFQLRFLLLALLDLLVPFPSSDSLARRFDELRKAACSSAIIAISFTSEVSAFAKEI